MILILSIIIAITLISVIYYFQKLYNYFLRFCIQKIYEKEHLENQIKHLQQQKKDKEQFLNNLNNLNKSYLLKIEENKKQLEERRNKSIIFDKQFSQKEKNLNDYYNILKDKMIKSSDCYEKVLDTHYKQIEEKFQKDIKKLQSQRQLAQTELDQLKAIYQAAAAAQIRQKQKQDEWRFYSIHLSDNEATDIAKLQEWKQNLFDPSIVGKVIWSTYIIKPTGDLCNRVLGSDKVCGIYKLTNKATGQVYIGQSVDVANRFKQHIKCGLGIDTPPASATKLYKAMQESSLWYWTFELIEKCPSNKLNEREKYWIEFYQSDKVGYNSTKGNK